MFEKREKPEAAGGGRWFSRADAARLCGLSARQFDEAVRPRAGKDAERGRGKTLKFDGAKVVQALVSYRIEQARPADDEADALLVGNGPDSPALERYRLARAKGAEMDLAERDRTLVSAAKLDGAMRAGIVALRSTGDRLKLKFGNEAAEIFNEGVGDFEAAALRAVRPERGDADKQVGGVAADAEAADAD